MKKIILGLLLATTAWAAYSPSTIITDPAGVNQAFVKPASTAPIATDPALVVAISPNSSLTVGSSVLPTGASTSALQTTGNTSLSNISGQLPATLGQKAMAASEAVVIASDQSAVPISAASLPLPTGASTSANQATINTNITNMSAKLPAALGQTTMANSLSVALASNQSALPSIADNTASGTIIATNGTVTLTTNGAGTTMIQITGVWSGAVNFNATVDGATFFNIVCAPSIGTNVGNATTNGHWACPSAGYSKIQASGSAWVSGTATVTMISSIGSNIVYPQNFAQGNFLAQVYPGNTPNTTPWLFSVNAGGNTATVTGSNALKVDGSAVTQPVSGTITANIGTTNGLALDASVTGLQVSQGSATAAQKGDLVQGAVTTAAPSYTTAQTSPLSLNTSGGLRVDGSGVTQPISAASLPLPTGAATAAKQPALGTAGSASADVISVQGVASMTPLKVDGSGVTQPVSIAGNQAVNVAQINGVTPLMGAGNTGTGSPRVTIASDQVTIPVSQQGRAKANAPVRNDYTSTAVTTAAYVQLVASTTSATSVICVFDSSGQTLTIATGAAASEVNQMNVSPGGNGCEPLTIAAGTRVSIKSLSATANVGELDVNFYQ